MSYLVEDTQAFYAKYFPELPALTKGRLRWRCRFLEEELKETITAVETGDAPEVVDGLIDLIVVALGTLHEAGVDINRAWDEVFTANMNKEVGSKDERPGSAGFDLIKPEGWVAPDHSANVGALAEELAK